MLEGLQLSHTRSSSDQVVTEDTNANDETSKPLAAAGVHSAGDENGDAFVDHIHAVAHVVPRLYRRRWLMAMLFAAYSLTNAYQWIHLNIIGDKILMYYNASLPDSQYEQDLALDWLSMVYMLAYIPLIFPTTWLLDRKGLRIVGILGTLLNMLGAWLKCAAVNPDRFALLMTAQTICAIAQVFILGIPARLAAVWFGPNEVSTATAIGVFGNQVTKSVLNTYISCDYLHRYFSE